MLHRWSDVGRILVRTFRGQSIQIQRCLTYHYAMGMLRKKLKSEMQSTQLNDIGLYVPNTPKLRESSELFLRPQPLCKESVTEGFHLDKDQSRSGYGRIAESSRAPVEKTSSAVAPLLAWHVQMLTLRM